MRTLYDGRGAELLALAAGAFLSPPYFVEFLGGGVQDGGFVSEDTGLKVAAEGRFHAHAGTCEIGASDIADEGVDDDDFEMHARAQHLFQVAFQQGIAVEVLLERLSRLLGMNEADFHVPANQLGKDV